MRSDHLATEAPSVPQRRAPLVLALLLVLAVAGTLPLVAAALRDPVHVDRVAVENSSPWRLNVAVSDADEDGWYQLGPVDREELRDFREVVDQGERWTFRFSYDGSAVTTDLTRDELAEAGWQVSVPDALAAELEESGVPETPR
jgi:hypothetical protein